MSSRRFWRAFSAPGMCISSRLLDRYQVTAIYKNPDSDLPHRLAMLPMCTHDRHFTADNLNHDIFNLYY